MKENVAGTVLDEVLGVLVKDEVGGETDVVVGVMAGVVVGVVIGVTTEAVMKEVVGKLVLVDVNVTVEGQANVVEDVLRVEILLEDLSGVTVKELIVVDVLVAVTKVIVA